MRLILSLLLFFIMWLAGSEAGLADTASHGTDLVPLVYHLGMAVILILVQLSLLLTFVIMDIQPTVKYVETTNSNTTIPIE